MQAYDPVRMEKDNRRSPQMGISHSESRQMTIVEEKAGCANDDGSPNDGNGGIELAKTVEVQPGFAIETIRRDVCAHDEEPRANELVRCSCFL